MSKLVDELKEKLLESANMSRSILDISGFFLSSILLSTNISLIVSNSNNIHNKCLSFISIGLVISLLANLCAHLTSIRECLVIRNGDTCFNLTSPLNHVYLFFLSVSLSGYIGIFASSFLV